ncbi:MAG: cyclic 2,3-diphosphoglycerate synthase [Candidatus Thermoplasmatota archaeon]|nr:cyclic 2,3-diphosphoglycerate synthase [Candidatus Thermoplasmatota archaeon]
MDKIKTIILGAAGRDFHNFNTYYRNNPAYEIVAFTATQIPDIAGRKYPKELSGSLYPNGIPIYDEKDAPELIKKHGVRQVVLAYSDLPYEYVMHKSAMANAAGADFVLMGPENTMVKSTKPVIAVCAIRTGCGKSQTSRRIFKLLRDMGYKVASVRHPMPYGDLVKQAVQRFASYADLDKHECTIEEREEYEPYIDMGGVVFAGVDYEKILREAEKEADIVIWDGGNNDFPFFRPDLHVTVVDPHRAGHEVAYYPGEVNARMASVIVVNKEDTAKKEDIEKVKRNIKEINPNATIMDANSPLTLEPNKPELAKGKKALVIEDGPTVTHGEMKFGAGYVMAKNLGCKIIDPRPYAVGSIIATFQKYNHLSDVLPAMGYGKKQMKELEETINKSECDVVISGTPIDLNRIVKVNKPMLHVRYELDETSKPDFPAILKDFVAKYAKKAKK